MANLVKEPCDEGVILAGAPTKACAPAKGRWILAATILASSMAFIDGTVVNVALPFLQRELQATVVGIQWVIEAYSLFLAALLLVGGSLGDRFGRRRIFLAGVIVFALASAACGLAANVGQLILARAVQGVGGALLVPGSLALISASFNSEQRGRAIGTWSGFSAITTAVGPVLGGWLIEHVSWRAVFFLNLPIAVAVFAISLWHVPESKDENAQGHLDWAGAALGTLGLSAIVYGLIELSRPDFSRPGVVAALISGMLALLAFLVVEGRVKNPMLPLRLFRSKDFAGANLLTLLLYAGLSGTMFFLTLNLVQVQGYSATAAGAVFLPFIVIMFALSRWSGGLVDRFGPRRPLIVGPIVAGAGFALLTLQGVDGGYWSRVFPGVAVLGLGMALSVAPLTTTVMGSVGQEFAGVASGINNAVSRTAGLLAIAVFGAVLTHTFNHKLETQLQQVNVSEAVRENVFEQRIKLAGLELPHALTPEQQSELKHVVATSFISGYRILMLIAACLALGSAASSWFFIGRKDNAEH